MVSPLRRGLGSRFGFASLFMFNFAYILEDITLCCHRITETLRGWAKPSHCVNKDEHARRPSAVQKSNARSRVTASMSSAFATWIVISKRLVRLSVRVLSLSFESPATRR